MEKIAVISYGIMGILLCIALVFGNIAEKQINYDNSCDETSYKKFKKYIGLMLGTYVFMLVLVIALAIYVYAYK